MQKLIMLKGLPGSGKSGRTGEILAEFPEYCSVSKDDIRFMLGGKYSREKEKAVVAYEDELIRDYLLLGRSVIVDDTNLNPYHETRLRRIAKDCGAAFVVIMNMIK